MIAIKKMTTKIASYLILLVFVPTCIFCLTVYYLMKESFITATGNNQDFSTQVLPAFQVKLIVAGLIIGLVIIVFSTLLARKLTIPLETLIQSAAQIRKGELDHAIQIDGNEVFKLLGLELEQLRMKLQESYQSLEGKIEQRTAELKEAQAQIIHQEKMASLGLMAAGIAHEIGNPLTSISSVAQVLKRKNIDEQVGNYINDIMKNIDRISRIVRELVDFSRPSSYKTASTNVNEIIKSAVGIMKYDRRAKNITFKLTLDNDLPETVLVSDQLLQVFLNILINALDASEEKGDKVIVSSHHTADKINVVIKDYGCGIPEENLHHIFEPFYTTKQVGRGTGLGLTVSYGIIQQLGGNIQVRSKVNEGSSFEIFIPVNGNR